MDPISQAALGAATGQAIGHARLGYRAAAIGALAGAAPDIDVLFSVGGDYFDQLVLHRGITHSLFFGPVVGPLAGWLIWQLERRWSSPLDGSRTRLWAWILVVSAALLSHPLLDVLTTYGTQLLQPFSDARFAVNAMPIIDPVYTLMLCAGLWIAARKLRTHAQQVASITLAISTCYLGAAWYLNEAAEREASRQLEQAGISDARVAAFPTLLQIHYRRVVARTSTEDRVGYLSMWEPCPIAWTSAPRRTSPATAAYLATREGRIFDWFTMGWIRFTLPPAGRDGWLVATDLRYGSTSDPDESFFTTIAPVGADGRLAGIATPASQSPEVTGAQLAGLLADTYQPFCTMG